MLPRLLGISRAFTFAKALNVSAKLDVYTLLSKHPQGLNWKQIAQALGLQHHDGFRGMVDFLDLLVSLGTVTRLDDPSRETLPLYCNHPSAARFLVKGSADYCGGIMVLNNDRSYLAFEHLEHALRTGKAPEDERIPDIHDVFGSASLSISEHFSNGMMGASLGNFRALAETFDWSKYTSLADMGGSNGCLCACVGRRHPHLRAVSYDLSPVREVAQSYLMSQGFGPQGDARVQALDHDFFSERPFPSGHDVITMGMVLHDWGLQRKRLLVSRAFEALPAGGAFIAIDNLVDDERKQSPLQLGMSLNMLLEFGEENAYDYTFAEFKLLVQEAGFSRAELLPLQGTTSAAIAYKG